MMWIRYGAHMINIGKFSAFFARKKKLLGLDENGNIHVISKFKDERDLKHALDFLGDKLKSV